MRTHTAILLLSAVALAGAACVGDPPVPCTACGDVCADLQNDSRHCGMCGRTCAVGQTCRAGTCTCGTGQLLCGSACTNPQTDSANCGTCGNACPQGLTCNNGSCNCAPGQTACSGRCVDLTSDRTNCGACGTACRAPEFCVGGTCQVTCPAPLSACGDTCVNFTSDRNNCGRCGAACLAGQNCVAGACQCPPGQTECAGGCFDTNTSLVHCGRCGQACMPANATPACVAGSCNYTSCDAGFSDCDGDRSNGCERNTTTDIANCGSCRNVCRPVNVATSTAALDASVFLPDGGIGVSICTGIGVPCFSASAPDGGRIIASNPDYPVGVACTSSTCDYSQCIQGFFDCDGDRRNGCEVNGRADRSNCGGCNIRCSAAQTCTRGECLTCRRTALLLTDINSQLETTLRAAGFTVTRPASPSHSAYSGTPRAADFGVVVMASANDFADMPLAGQTAIVQAVNAGTTGFVSGEWFGYLGTLGGLLGTLRPLGASTYSNLNFLSTSYTHALVAPEHPIWDGVDPSFTTASNWYHALTQTALPDGGVAIGQMNNNGGYTVAVRTRPGRVVTVAFNLGYSFAVTGNTTWFNDRNVTTLVTNSAVWAAGCK